MVLGLARLGPEKSYFYPGQVRQGRDQRICCVFVYPLATETRFFTVEKNQQTGSVGGKNEFKNLLCAHFECALIEQHVETLFLSQVGEVSSSPEV